MALENDTQAPDFELVSQFGERIQLSRYRGEKSVALVFFPLAFSGICSGELCELRDNLSMFADSSVELIGISVDSRHTLRAWGDQEGYGFTLLSDFWPHGSVAKEYGVFLEEKGFANRATFLIDPNGIIRASFITAPGEARSLEAYRAALDELQPASSPV
ncbi:MAG: peroxiredoxin [Cryobacterium sp.]